VLEENPVSVSHSFPQILRRLSWYRTCASAVKGVANSDLRIKK